MNPNLLHKSLLRRLWNQTPAGRMVKGSLDRRIKNPGCYPGLDLSLRGKEETLSRGESGSVVMATSDGLQESKLCLSWWVPITGEVHPRLRAQLGYQPIVSISEHTAAQLQNTLQPSSRGLFPWAQGPGRETCLSLEPSWELARPGRRRYSHR